MKLSNLHFYAALCLVGPLVVNAKTIECTKRNGKSLTIQITADKKLPYDPTTTGFAHITFSNAVLGRLLRLNSNLTVQPGLLEAAYWDFKKGHYVLKLRPNTRFHNGRLIVPEDLDFSLTRFFLSEKRVDQVAFLRHIKGIDKFRPGMKYKPWSVSGIKKLDERSLSVSLISPNPAFLYSLAEGWISLVPQEELREDLVTWKSTPVGAGSYRVEGIDGHILKLCRVADSGSAPDKLEFLSDVDAHADIVGFINSDYAAKHLQKVYGSGPIGFSGIFFNAQSPLGSNLHFRKAIFHAIDRKEIVGQNPDFSPLNELLASNFYGRLQRPDEPDLALSKAELSKIPERLLRRPLKVHWFSGRTSLSSDERRIIDKVTKQLAVIGVHLVFGPSDHPTFSPADTETVLRIDDRGTAFTDPLPIFRAFELPAFLSPFFPRDNAKLKELLAQASMAESLDVKAESIFLLSTYFFENAIVVPLYERKTVYWVNPTKVADLGLQTGITFDVDRIKTR